jgi:hypothetical protein
MSRARCPYCGKVNTGGLLAEVRPGEPTPMLDLCEHFVFEVFTQLPSDYLDSELHKNLNQLPGVTAHGRDIEVIVSKHLALEGPMAFAKSDSESEAAKAEVTQFLRSRGFEL